MAKNPKTQLLLIEDNPGDVRFIQLLLDKSDFQFHLLKAPTFLEADQILQNTFIELVLLDLSLPDMNGFKTLTRFIQKNPQIPVIVLTSTNNEIIGIQSIKAGAQDYLVKGEFDGKLLSRSIRYSLQRFKAQEKLKRTADKLAINEKRVAEIQKLAKLGFWEMDIVSQKMNWSPQMFYILEMPTQSLNPSLSDLIELARPEDRQKIEGFFEQAAKDGKPHQINYRMLIDGRKLKTIRLHAKIHFDKLTQKLIMLGSLQDVSDLPINLS